MITQLRPTISIVRREIGAEQAITVTPPMRVFRRLAEGTQLTLAGDAAHGTILSKISTPSAARQIDVPQRGGRQLVVSTLGLELPIRLQAERMGIGVDARCTERCRTRELRVAEHEAVTPDVAAICDFFAEKRLGIVRHAPGLRLGLVLANLCRRYPTASIAVSCARRKLIDAILETLRGESVLIERLAADLAGTADRRVVIGTPAALHAITETRDIVLFAGFGASLSRKRIWPYSFARQARMFAFVPGLVTGPPSLEAQLRRYFGFEELRITTPTFAMRPAQIWWQRIAGGMQINADCDADCRAQLLTHPVRQRLLVALARGIESQSIDARRFGMPESLASLLNQRECRLLLAAGALEHAMSFAEVLPDWNVSAATDAYLGGLGVSELPMYGETDEVTPKFVIATPEGLSNLRVHDFDVIIRADAGSGVLPLHLRSFAGPACNLRGPWLVIDLNDHELGAGPAQLTARRRRAYLDELGWGNFGERAAESLAKRFLADRL